MRCAGGSAGASQRSPNGAKEHRHAPMDQQQKTLNAKLRGHYQYYGRPTNSQSLLKFYRGVVRDLEEVAQSPHAREPDDVGEIQTTPSSVSFAVTSDSTSLDVPGESCLRNPLREICTVGSVREEIPVVPWWTYTGTKLETADTAKENLHPIGTSLL